MKTDSAASSLSPVAGRDQKPMELQNGTSKFPAREEVLYDLWTLIDTHITLQSHMI